MDKINYIYFEIHSRFLKNEGEDTYKIIEGPSIKNENALLIKPHTNSAGYWGFTNRTDSSRPGRFKQHLTVEQYWVDYEKCNGEHISSFFNTRFNEALELIKNKIKNMEYKYDFMIGEDTIWSCNAWSEQEAIEMFSEVKNLSPETIEKMYKIKTSI